MSSRGEPKFAFGGAAPPEVSVRLRWPSGQNDGANSGAPDADDVFASGSPRAVGAAAGSPASSPSSSPVASADSLGSSLSAPRGAASSAGAHAERGGKELLDTLTERVRELEAQHRRDVQEIELLRAEVDSKTAEVAAKEADIKLKDTELAQAEQVAHSRGLLVESLLAELEEMKTSLEYAQLETMALSNGVDFVKAAQECRSTGSSDSVADERHHATSQQSEPNNLAAALAEAQAEVTSLNAIVEELKMQAKEQGSSGDDTSLPVGRTGIIPFRPPNKRIHGLPASTRALGLKLRDDILPSSCPVAPAQDDLSDWLEGGSNAPFCTTPQEPEGSTEWTMNGRFQMLSPTGSVKGRKSQLGTPVRRLNSRRGSKLKEDRPPSLDLLHAALESLKRDREETVFDSGNASDTSASSRRGATAVGAARPMNWHWETSESRQESPRDRLKADVESDWSRASSGVDSPRCSLRSSRRRRMVVKQMSKPALSQDEEEALLQWKSSGGLLKRSYSENQLSNLQEEYDELLSPSHGSSLVLRTARKGRAMRFNLAGQDRRKMLSQGGSCGSLLEKSVLESASTWSPAGSVSGDGPRTKRIGSASRASKKRSPLQALAAQVELRRTLMREKEEQVRRKEKKLASSASSVSGYNSDSMVTYHSPNHELKQMREELAERTKLDMLALEQDLLECTYEMEQALESEIENAEKLQLEIQCLESKLRQERLDRQDAAAQVLEARAHVDSLAQRLESTVNALGVAQEKQHALQLDRDDLANRLDTAEQDMKRKFEFWCWERDAMLGKLCEQMRASEDYVLSVEHALRELQAAAIDGVASLKKQHNIKRDLERQIDSLSAQLRARDETSLADSQGLERVCALEEQLERTQMAHEKELDLLRETHRSALEEQRRVLVSEHEQAFVRELDDRAHELEKVRKQMIALEDDHREAMSAAASTHRSEMAKVRDELWESFIKLKRSSEVTLSLFDTLSDLADQTREARNNISDIIAGEEEMADLVLHFEDFFALERDVMQRKIDALAYCLQQLEQEYSGGSRMYEKLMAACSNLEITRPDGAASSPECTRACLSCSDEYLCLLKQSFNKNFVAKQHHDQGHHTQGVDSNVATSAHSSSAAHTNRGTVGLDGGEGRPAAQQKADRDAPRTGTKDGPSTNTFSLGWWKDDGPRLPLALLSPREASMHQEGGDFSAEQFSEKLIHLCMEKLESKLGASGASDREACGSDESMSVHAQIHAVELAAAARDIEVAGHVVKLLALLTDVRAASHELEVEVQALARAVPQNQQPREAAGSRSARPTSPCNSVRGLNSSIASHTSKAAPPPSPYESKLVTGLRGLELEEFHDRYAARREARFSGGDDLNEIEVELDEMLRLAESSLRLHIECNEEIQRLEKRLEWSSSGPSRASSNVSNMSITSTNASPAPLQNIRMPVRVEVLISELALFLPVSTNSGIQVSIASARVHKAAVGSDGIRKSSFGCVSVDSQSRGALIRWNDERLTLRVDRAKERFAISCFDFSGTGLGEGGGGGRGGGDGANSGPTRQCPLLLGRASVGISRLLGATNHAIELEDKAGKRVGTLQIQVCCCTLLES